MAVEITDELQALRAEAERLGIVVDGRWGESRIRDEMADRLAGVMTVRFGDEPDTEDVGDEPDDDEPGEPETSAVRAGGHIDRGDGRGWMVED